MKIYFNEEPKYWVGNFPEVTIHYRKGSKVEAERIAEEIRKIKVIEEPEFPEQRKEE